ncbi:MAG: S1C family serine protease [Roseiarcus sp.]
MSKPESAVSLQHLSDALADLTARAARSVVSVRAARSRSSGFVWRPGLIVTAEEALAEEGEISVALPDGQSAVAAVVGRDPTTDVALLRVDRLDGPAAALYATPPSVGALAVVVGRQNEAPSAAFGAVSFVGGPWRSLRGGEIDARIELDLSLRRAGEGGLALDASGRALGMVVFGPRQRVLVIPAATIERVAAKLQTHGRIARGYLGLGLRPTRLDGDKGTAAMVMNVDANGPGAAAGLRQGDVIVKWSGEPIRDLRTVLRALGPDGVGSTVALSLLRGGAPAEAVLTIGERPES